MKPIQLLECLAREEEGAAASEYAILLAVIAAVVFAAVKLFNIGDIFVTASGKVQNCVNATGTSC